MTDELLAGRYQLEQELGRGGMATVFLARDLRLSRRVAVKVMHPGEEGRRAERFRREAELAASLKHPNVLEVHDFGEDPVRGPFLVCEWVQGEDLRELARRLAPVPPEAAAVVGWELARALEAAHTRGVVHRDVKPENVLVSRGGPLKLADFGLAALADQERLTSTGAVAGSLAYMAPERLDTGAWSPASDVYAVGVLLFELCAGTTPHAGRGSAHLAVSVMTRDAPPLTEAAPGTPEPLATLVNRCLARDARDRPADGAELAALLEEVVGRLAGPAAEASRRFFQAPEAEAARWREAGFQRLLDEGRALLARGEGARAAKLLNGALALRPGASEVMALLRARPRTKRAKVLGAGAVLAGLLGALVFWGVEARWGPSGALRSGEVPPSEAPSLVASAPAPPVTGHGAEPSVPVTEVDSAPDANAPGVSVGPHVSAPQASRLPPSHTVHPKRTVSATGEPSRPEAPPRTETSARPEAPRSEPQGFATLTVVARPWAEVFVDGQSRGYTPRVREILLTPGTHRLRFDNPLCDAVEEDLQVTAGETVTREVSLVVRQAEVAITAPAGARVFVDGEEVGVAPLRAPVKVGHGEHVVSARGLAGEVLRREFTGVAGKRTEVVLGGVP